MKKNLTPIFLKAAREVDSRPGRASCLAVACAAGCPRSYAVTSWKTYPEVAFYYEATGLSLGWDYDLWLLPANERRAVRVLLLCLMAAAWRDLPRDKYGL